MSPVFQEEGKFVRPEGSFAGPVSAATGVPCPPGLWGLSQSTAAPKYIP